MAWRSVGVPDLRKVSSAACASSRIVARLPLSASVRLVPIRAPARRKAASFFSSPDASGSASTRAKTASVTSDICRSSSASRRALVAMSAGDSGFVLGFVCSVSAAGGSAANTTVDSGATADSRMERQKSRSIARMIPRASRGKPRRGIVGRRLDGVKRRLAVQSLRRSRTRMSASPKRVISPRSCHCSASFSSCRATPRG